MLRLQTPLADRYVDAPAEELAERIAAAKATLGDRLFILGHHYQREEVMTWADARGDSFRLSVLAQQQTALLVLRAAQVPQDLLADAVLHDHQQAAPGGHPR
jgi:quinolinate synthase